MGEVAEEQWNLWTSGQEVKGVGFTKITLV